ncbi:4238_t:CDS:2 [Diversispora eburnea]|uniref:4238_t:CDS:1 n=1 Tax=Diversispora eburnea TaxID=1213867 RepID=A0A9N9FXL8_9GLOM|nr:4238_t:CDS:2 [Diversispora eburnea]
MTENASYITDNTSNSDIRQESTTSFILTESKSLENKEINEFLDSKCKERVSKEIIQRVKKKKLQDQELLSTPENNNSNILQALPYGGMPSSALNRKMEETDLLLIDTIAQVDAFHDQEDYYTDYARGQIVDRKLEEPWLESDLPLVDPIRHPELSLGFLGNDPRGNQIGPNINKISKQMQRRKTGLTIGMGTNADTQVPEKPWTEQAIRIGRNKIHNQLKDNTHVFSIQREGKINEVGLPSETNYAEHTIMRNPEEYNTSGPKHTPFNMYMILAIKGMVQTETGFEQKGDQQLVLLSGFEKSIPKNSRELILPSNTYPLKQERHLTLQDITSHTETFRRPILTSNPYSMDEMQRENQERNLPLQDVTFNTGIFRRPILPRVLPAIYSEKAVQGSLVSNVFPNTHLANIAGVIRSLRTERSAPLQKNSTPFHKEEFIQHLNQVLPKSAEADKLNIYVYSSASPQVSTERLNSDNLWQHTYENSPILRLPLPKW